MPQPGDHVYVAGVNNDVVHCVNAVYQSSGRIALWCALNQIITPDHVVPAEDTPVNCLGCIAAMPKYHGDHIRVDGEVHIIAWWSEHMPQPQFGFTETLTWRIACDVVLRHYKRCSTKAPLTCKACIERGKQPRRMDEMALLDKHVIAPPPKGDGLVHFAESSINGHMNFPCGQTVFYMWLSLAPPGVGMSCIGCIALKS